MKSMFFHVILTTECNSQCSYCYGEALQDWDDDQSELEVDYSLPKKISYPISQLKTFCAKDPYCVLTFYGGEPLLCLDEIKQIIDSVHPTLFMMQTNGLFLDRLEPQYVNRFRTFLVSIDGDEALTDFYRGSGTFRKVMNNMKLIKKNGFDGELIARMTVMESTDIYKQVKWLLENDELPFSSIHWQLNAGFWKSDFPRRDFKKWSEQSYDPGVRKLVKFWIDHMKETGVVLRLYPLLGIAESLLSGEKSLLRCGGGWINYAIQTDGQIIVCPTMWGIKNQYLGHIAKIDPMKLSQVFVTEPCTQCKLLNLCGGRCLYANFMKRWSPNAYGLVCRTVCNLVETVSQQMPEIQELINKRRISFKDFEFIRFNGCEIIP
jgi:uncharacterized protein